MKIFYFFIFLFYKLFTLFFLFVLLFKILLKAKTHIHTLQPGPAPRQAHSYLWCHLHISSPREVFRGRTVQGPVIVWDSNVCLWTLPSRTYLKLLLRRHHALFGNMLTVVCLVSLLFIVDLLVSQTSSQGSPWTPQCSHRGTMGYSKFSRQTQSWLAFIGHCVNYQLQAVHSFNSKSCYFSSRIIYHITFILAVVIKSKRGVKIDVQQEMRVVICNLTPGCEQPLSA